MRISYHSHPDAFECFSLLSLPAYWLFETFCGLEAASKPVELLCKLFFLFLFVLDCHKLLDWRQISSYLMNTPVLAAIFLFTAEQLCGSSPPLFLSHLLNLFGVSWLNDWCPCDLLRLLVEAPVPLHDEYTCIHTTEAIDTPGGRQIKSYGRAGRADCFSSRQQKGERVAATPEDLLERERERGANSCRAALPCRSSLTHFLPSSAPLYSLSTSLRTHFDTSDQSPGDTVGPHSCLSSSSNNYGDRVAQSAKPGPLGSQQHIVQPD